MKAKVTLWLVLAALSCPMAAHAVPVLRTLSLGFEGDPTDAGVFRVQQSGVSWAASPIVDGTPQASWDGLLFADAGWSVLETTKSSLVGIGGPTIPLGETYGVFVLSFLVDLSVTTQFNLDMAWFRAGSEVSYAQQRWCLQSIGTNTALAASDCGGVEWLPTRAGVFATTVPEPGTLALFGIGLLALAVRRRRAVN